MATTRTTPKFASDREEATRWHSSVVDVMRDDVKAVGDDDVPAGAKVIVFTRGAWRLVTVVRSTRQSVVVAYTTDGGIAELDRYGRAAITETRRSRSETYWPAKAEPCTDDTQEATVSEPTYTRRDAFSFGNPAADEAVQELAKVERELARRREARRAVEA